MFDEVYCVLLAIQVRLLSCIMKFAHTIITK